MPIDDEKLDFAYKYPVSLEARSVIESLNSKKIEERYLRAGALRLEEALRDSRIEFTEARTNDIKLVYLISYIYSRMLVSAIVNSTSNTTLLARYAIAEAKRLGEALFREDSDRLIRFGEELRLHLTLNGDESFSIPFYEYVNVAPRGKEYMLIHQRLDKGMISLPKNRVVRVFEETSRRRILKGLPIALNQLPREVIECANRIHTPKRQIEIVRAPRTSAVWIDRLLETPLPDFRHRVVNLIFAPYLVNIKKLGEEDAAKIIIDYVERCKRLNPNTSITESYVRYQCRYAKRRGLKPYSLKRAKDLIGNVIDFDSLTERDEKR